MRQLQQQRLLLPHERRQPRPLRLYRRLPRQPAALCAARHRQRGRRRGPAVYFFLEMDSLCLWHTAPAGPDTEVVEFRAAAVIPCVHLDPSDAACAYAADVGLYLVRGGRVAAGTAGDAVAGRRRRLLEQTPVPAEPASAVWSRDPLRSSALAETRSACAAVLRRSNETLATLGLACALPPCALCSLADAVHAAETNPVTAMHLLIHDPAVLVRHGPLAEAAAVFAAVCEGAQRLAAAVQADTHLAVVLGPDGAPCLDAHVVEDCLLQLPISLTRKITFVLGQFVRITHDHTSVCNRHSLALEPLSRYLSAVG